MYSEWSDICTLLYGGNFASGGYYQGLKNIAPEYNTSIFETVYGLGNTLPSVAQSGNCAEHYQNGQGPRNSALGENDDSGGLRTLPELSTMVRPTQDTPVKTGGQVLTGLAFHARMQSEMSQVTHQHQQIISGTVVRLSLFYLYQMKVQKTGTLLNKRMTLLR